MFKVTAKVYFTQNYDFTSNSIIQLTLFSCDSLLLDIKTFKFNKIYVRKCNVFPTLRPPRACLPDIFLKLLGSFNHGSIITIKWICPFHSHSLDGLWFS